MLVEEINTNKYLLGLCMILFNLGSKYLTIDLSKRQERFLKHTLIRRLIVFAIFFVATRDILVSTVLTVTFIVFVLHMFNDQSPYNLMPPTFFDDEYTLEEYEMAKKIVAYYQKKSTN
jgi:hypothetical protein